MMMKWNNIVARRGSNTKKDPPDAKFTALSSERISSLKNQIVEMQKGNGGTGGNRSGSGTKSFIPDWCKTKTLGKPLTRMIRLSIGAHTTWMEKVSMSPTKQTLMTSGLHKRRITAVESK